MISPKEFIGLLLSKSDFNTKKEAISKVDSLNGIQKKQRPKSGNRPLLNKKGCLQLLNINMRQPLYLLSKMLRFIHFESTQIRTYISSLKSVLLCYSQTIHPFEF